MTGKHASPWRVSFLFNHFFSPLLWRRSEHGFKLAQEWLHSLAEILCAFAKQNISRRNETHQRYVDLLRFQRKIEKSWGDLKIDFESTSVILPASLRILTNKPSGEGQTFIWTTLKEYTRPSIYVSKCFESVMILPARQSCEIYQADDFKNQLPIQPEEYTSPAGVFINIKRYLRHVDISFLLRLIGFKNFFKRRKTTHLRYKRCLKSDNHSNAEGLKNSWTLLRVFRTKLSTFFIFR